MAKEKLVELQVPEKVYKPDIGDVLWEAKEWLAEIAPLLWDSDRWDAIYLELIHKNPWQALRDIAVHAEQLISGSSYCCPYTGYGHFGIVPNAILSKNPEQYRKQLVKTRGPDLAMLDFDWVRKMCACSANEPSDIQKLLLGSGYTGGTLPCDGSGEIQVGYVCLSNGDMLRVHFWEWYNK